MGRGPDTPQFLAFIYIYAYTLYGKTTKYDEVTHVGRGLRGLADNFTARR